MSNTVYLFVCHILNRRLEKAFHQIQSSIKNNDRALVLFHQQAEDLPDCIRPMPHAAFSDKTLSELGYPMLNKTFTPGSTHFPLIDFFRKNTGYAYYWFIEYDVRYTGDWKHFFDYWESSKSDFLTSHIRNFTEEPDWYWWGLKHSREKIPIENRYRSFNTIYRMSNRSIALIDKKHQEGWVGHHEELLPTLLYHNGCSIRDFGGTGPFVRSEDKNRFYKIGRAHV